MRTWWTRAVAVLAIAVSMLFGSAPFVHAQNTCAGGGGTGGTGGGDAGASLPTLYAALPLSFERNEGQVDSRVTFLGRGADYAVYLTATEAVLAMSTPVTDPGGVRRFQSENLKMTLVGANPEPRVAGRDALPGKRHYFRQDRATWRTNVPTYAKVTYEAVYPGVDLVYYGNQRRLEYDFVVAPGADPHAITLAFTGAKTMRLDRDGALVLALAAGDISQPAPIVYQEVNGVRASIPGRYVVKDTTSVGFDVGPYDTSRPLVIDPTLVYSTYLGGSCATGDAE